MFGFRLVREWYYRSLLDSEDVTKRSAAAPRLGEIGSTVAIPRLLELLRTEPFAVLLEVPELSYPAAALVAIGGPAVPQLLEAFGENDAELVGRTYLIIVKVGRRAVPSLIEALTYDRSKVRKRAVLSLAALGKEATPAIPHLVRLLESDLEDGNGDDLAWEALSSVGPAAIPELRELLGRENRHVRYYALVALSCMEVAPSQLEPAIEAALKDSDPELRELAARTLRQQAHKRASKSRKRQKGE